MGKESMCVMLGTSEREIQLQNKLKTIVEKEVKDKNYDNNFLAKKLGLLPSGVSLLFERQSWSLGIGIRVAIALGLEVNLEVK